PREAGTSIACLRGIAGVARHTPSFRLCPDPSQSPASKRGCRATSEADVVPATQSKCQVLSKLFTRSSATRSKWALLGGDVAPQEDEVGGDERDRRVERAHPERADDGRPVGRDPQEAVPGLEL